jgi:hypothetical protein
VKWPRLRPCPSAADAKAADEIPAATSAAKVAAPRGEAAIVKTSCRRQLVAGLCLCASWINHDGLSSHCYIEYIQWRLGLHGLATAAAGLATFAAIAAAEAAGAAAARGHKLAAVALGIGKKKKKNWRSQIF